MQVKVIVSPTPLEPRVLFPGHRQIFGGLKQSRHGLDGGWRIIHADLAGWAIGQEPDGESALHQQSRRGVLKPQLEPGLHYSTPNRVARLSAPWVRCKPSRLACVILIGTPFVPNTSNVRSGCPC